MKNFLIFAFSFFLSTNVLAQNSKFAFNTWFELMNNEQITKEIIGNFYFYRHPEELGIDIYQNTIGFKTHHTGLSMYEPFAQKIYPSKGSGNITGSIAKNALYTEGKWYKGLDKENERVLYMLFEYRLLLDIRRFENRHWVGDETIKFSAKPNSAILLIKSKDNIWYYRGSKGSFPFKKDERSVRDSATNSKGTGYGTTDSLAKYQEDESAGTFTDSRDGNVYKAVKIANKVWMAENLKYLPKVVGHATGSYTNPHYYVYGYNGTDVNAAKATANYSTYGVLYNWPAAMADSKSSTVNPSGVQGICPTGWHLPSDAEWIQLTQYLGTAAGGKLKETGTAHWESPNDRATNEKGFTALPGGYRGSDGGTFSGIGGYGGWWSATEGSAARAWNRNVGDDGSNVIRGNYRKEVGFSVRCVRD